MYLTKIRLERSNPGYRASVRDAQRMHRLVTGLFNVARKDADILYRCYINGVYMDLYIYSGIKVDQERILPGMHLVGERNMSEWLNSLKSGDIYEYQILTSPFKKVAEEGAKNSRRRILRIQEDRIVWLQKKAEQNGFTVLSAVETPSERINAVHPDDKGGQLLSDVYCYTGALRINDADMFRNAVCHGIGPGKAYGLGMILLKRS